MENLSSPSPLHFLSKYSFGGGMWGTHWVLAFVVNPDDTVSMFNYRNGLTGIDSHLKRLVAYPIVDKTTGWTLVGVYSKEDGRREYKKWLDKGYKPVKA